MIRKRKPSRAARFRNLLGAIVLVLAGSSAVAPAALAATGLAVRLTVSPALAAPNANATWTITLTPSGGTVTNAHVDLGFDWVGSIAEVGCSPAPCNVDGRTLHVVWNVPSVAAPTALSATITVAAAARPTIVGNVYVNSDQANGYATTTLQTVAQSASATLTLNPTKATPTSSALGPMVTFAATYTYVPGSGGGCYFSTSVTWDTPNASVRRTAISINPQNGCKGTDTIYVYNPTPGVHKVCAGALNTTEYPQVIACANFTVLTAVVPPQPTATAHAPVATGTPVTSAAAATPTQEATPSPSPSPIASPSVAPTPSPSATPVASASSVASATGPVGGVSSDGAPTSSKTDGSPSVLLIVAGLAVLAVGGLAGFLARARVLALLKR